MAAYVKSPGAENLVEPPRVVWSGDATKSGLPVTNPDGTSIAGGGGGGSQYADGATPGTPLANLLAWYTGSAVQFVNASNGLPVNVVSGASGGGASIADRGAFTLGTTSLSPIGGVFDDSPPSALTTGMAGVFRVTARRAQHVNLRDASGGELGVSGTPLYVQFASAQAVTQSGTWNVTNISGTISLPTGAATSAKQPALGTAGAASTDVITIQGIASMTPIAANVAQVNGVTVLMGNGVTGTGSQRVTIASDNTAFSVNAIESGTWTVQPGNTANTTPWLVSLRPAASGGNSVFHVASAASTNATTIKASAGQVYGFSVQNTNAAARYLAFHNAASTPTAGASVFAKFLIPGATAGAGNNTFIPAGFAMGTGISISTVTGAADSDSTGVGANDLIINIFYT